MDKDHSSNKPPTAYLVDLVTNRKIPISVPCCKVGRDNLNDVVITGDQSISRFHFVISKEGEQYYVEDSKSRHGTFLNGNQVTSIEPITDGDVVKVGISLFWFVLDSQTISGERSALPSGKTEIVEVEVSSGNKTIGPKVKNQALFAASRTSDNMPAMNPDAQLTTGVSSNTQNSNELNLDQTSLSHTSGLSKLLAQPAHEDEPSVINQPLSTRDDELKETVVPEEASDAEANAHPSSTTLGLFAEAIGELAAVSERKPPPKADETKVENPPSEMVKETIFSWTDKALSQSTSSKSANESSQSGSNGAKNQMETVERTAIQTEPNWRNSYLAAELDGLAGDLVSFNEKVRQAQQKVQEIEDCIAVTKSLRNALLATQGDELVGACIRVLTYLGWHVKPNAEDRQELQLLIDDKICIVRVVWTNNTPERTHLGELTISQTKYWCEQGAEPKGILIIGRIGMPPFIPDSNSELAEYAASKNICLMTTLQLLALYRDAVLNNIDAEGLRAKIMSASGWLPDFDLSPSTSHGDKAETSSNEPSSLLSA